MAKTSNIILRVDEEAKRRISEAARRTGESLSSFVTEAAMEAVENAERRLSQEARGSRRGGAYPTFFRALCGTAKTGGAMGYSVAGYELTGALGSVFPDEMDG